MFERFGRDASSTVRRARERAQTLGAADLEAEHLLLALADAPRGRAVRALGSLGVTPEAISHALAHELASALAAVGVSSSPADRALPSSPTRRVPRWGQSAKLALARALAEATARGDRSIGDEHLLLAIVSAEAGRVPRLLDELGIDATKVRDALEPGAR